MLLSEKLYALRRSHNLSQEELAEKLAVSRQAVSKWESGTAHPELSKLIELSRLFDVSMDELLIPEHETSAAGETAQNVPSIRNIRTVILLTGALCILFLLITFSCFFYQHQRIGALNERIDSLQSQLGTLQSSLSDQLYGIGDRMQNILDQQTNPILQYEANVSRIDLDAELCTIDFMLLPKTVSEDLSVSLQFSLDDSVPPLRLEQDDFGAYRASTVLPLADNIRVTAQFSDSTGQSFCTLESLPPLHTYAFPALEVSFPWTIRKTPSSTSFAIGELDASVNPHALWLGAYSDREIEDVYIDCISNGQSIGHISLLAAPAEQGDAITPLSGFSSFFSAGSYSLSVPNKAELSLSAENGSSVSMQIVVKLSNNISLRMITDRFYIPAYEESSAVSHEHLVPAEVSILK